MRISAQILAIPWFLVMFLLVWIDTAIRAVPDAWDQAYRMVLR